MRAALETEVLERRRIDPGVVCHNSGGWHSDRDLHLWGPPIAPLLAVLAELGEIYYGWANINSPGDFNRSHTHVGPWTTAGVLFVSGRSGDLVLEYEDGPEVRITPEPGMIVLFPALTPHRVDTGKDLRITIAFNLR